MAGGKRFIDVKSESLSGHLTSVRAPHPAWIELRYYMLQKSRCTCSGPNDTPTTLIPCRTTVSLQLSIARCSGPTSSATRACEFLRFSEMPSTPRRYAAIRKLPFRWQNGCDIDNERNRFRTWHRRFNSELFQHREVACTVAKRAQIAV